MNEYDHETINVYDHYTGRTLRFQVSREVMEDLRTYYTYPLTKEKVTIKKPTYIVSDEFI